MITLNTISEWKHTWLCIQFLVFWHQNVSLRIYYSVAVCLLYQIKCPYGARFFFAEISILNEGDMIHVYHHLKIDIVWCALLAYAMSIRISHYWRYSDHYNSAFFVNIHALPSDFSHRHRICKQCKLKCIYFQMVINIKLYLLHSKLIFLQRRIWHHLKPLAFIMQLNCDRNKVSQNGSTGTKFHQCPA